MGEESYFSFTDGETVEARIGEDDAPDANAEEGPDGVRLGEPVELTDDREEED